MIIAKPLEEDHGARLFIGWQATVDVVFEAFRADASNPDYPFASPATARVNAGQFLPAC